MCIKLTMVSMKLQIVVSEGEATTAEAIMQRPVQVLASIALPLFGIWFNLTIMFFERIRE